MIFPLICNIVYLLLAIVCHHIVSKCIYLLIFVVLRIVIKAMFLTSYSVTITSLIIIADEINLIIIYK